GAVTRSTSAGVVQMQRARSTPAAAIAARISGSRSASSGKLRWQCESTYMGARGNRRAPRGRGAGSDRLGGLGRRQRGAERFLDLRAQRAALVVGREAHADALGAVAAGAAGPGAAARAADSLIAGSVTSRSRRGALAIEAFATLRAPARPGSRRRARHSRDARRTRRRGEARLPSAAARRGRRPR